jgi:serine/threonine protein kinase
MDPERWPQVKEILDAAIQRPPEERAAFLAAACSDDQALYGEVESLLDSYESEFLEQPAVGEFVNMPSAARSPLTAGQRISCYRITSLLGRGGMGEVYLAEDTNLGRKAALKFLTVSFMNDADRLLRFEQEARAASALNQPNILTVYGIGETDHGRFIATEYIEGETLRQRMLAGPLTLVDALGIAEQVAAAITAAHAAGIIHRDIKPENIMLRRDGLVKVLDFGLAKLVQQKTLAPEDSTRVFVKTSAGTVMGTVAYMSPEQARGLTVDARTDVWSLGVILYELISGKAPFSGTTTSDLLVSVLERNPPPLSVAIPDISETLEFVIMKALAKERDERYQTVHEILADIRRLKQRLSVTAEPERTVAQQGSEDLRPGRANTPDATAITLSRSRFKGRLVWATLLVAMVALASTIVSKGIAYWLKHATRTPVVVLMDSTLPDRVYDPETRKNGGTNADDITDILRDLPIDIQKENTSPLWHREDQLLRETPALIVIHRSCFADSAVGFDPKSTATQVADKKVESFLGYYGLGNPTTKFLTYTRRSEDQAHWVLDLETRFPQLKDRVVALTIPGGPEHATFRDPQTKKILRQEVESILGLP